MERIVETDPSVSSVVPQHHFRGIRSDEPCLQVSDIEMVDIQPQIHGLDECVGGFHRDGLLDATTVGNRPICRTTSGYAVGPHTKRHTHPGIATGQSTETSVVVAAGIVPGILFVLTAAGCLAMLNPAREITGTGPVVQSRIAGIQTARVPVVTHRCCPGQTARQGMTGLGTVTELAVIAGGVLGKVNNDVQHFIAQVQRAGNPV
jgi:hypothetical protein